jgi:hypothetical protein
VKLKKVNQEDKPKPLPRAGTGNHVDELMMRIRQREQAMAGKIYLNGVHCLRCR